MLSKEECSQRFNKASLLRQNNLFTAPRQVHDYLMFMDHKIRKHLQSFSLFNLCGSDRAPVAPNPEFQQAFSTMAFDEQVLLYERTVIQAISFDKGRLATVESSLKNEVEVQGEEIALFDQDPLKFEIAIQKGFRAWASTFITLDGYRVSAQGQLQIDLRNYLMRRSKKTDRDCYVLEATRPSEPKTVRFSFNSQKAKQKYLPVFKARVAKGYTEILSQYFNLEAKESGNGSRSRRRAYSQDETEKNSSPIHLAQMSPRQADIPIQHGMTRIVEQVLLPGGQQDYQHQLNTRVEQQAEQYERMRHNFKKEKQNQIQYYKKIVDFMLPQYHLNQLQDMSFCRSLKSSVQDRFFIFKSNASPTVFKLELLCPLEAKLALKALSNIHLYKNWHPEIVQSNVKLTISSQNSIIGYFKHLPVSKWYKERDFIFVRHVFKMCQSYYICDKSIEHYNFIPFDTIVRATLKHQVIKVTPSPNGCKIVIEADMDHGGMLNSDQKDEIMTKYLIGFTKMSTYFIVPEFQNKLKKYFKYEWNVRQNMLDQSRTSGPSINSSQFIGEQMSSKLDEEDVFFSIADGSEERPSKEDQQVHQLKEADFIKNKKQLSIRVVHQEINVDDQGLVILPKSYINQPHPNQPIEKYQKKRIEPTFEDIILRDDWNHLNGGGLVLVNKEIIKAQDSVIGFIMSTFKKNLFSGKGALNISLPVYIFNDDSQLQRLCSGMALGPVFLEKAATLSDPVERMKYCLLFGLTNSLLYFDIEKPFNPILGQTYQGIIAGCPIYAQQISHHPPISSLYFLGRGYKVYGNLQATVSIHINSADGINEGFYHIVFDDGQEVCFTTPPAELSGFTIGDRKFQIIQKGYYFDEKNQLFSQMHFEDPHGYFSSQKWSYRDQFQAQIVKVTPEFIPKMVSSLKKGKKLSPSAKQIVERHDKFYGRWPFETYCNGQKIYQVNKDLPYEMIDYAYPLNSNSSYREDLYYHKLRDMSRSQQQKERLQNVQRNDRKLRQKYHGKSSH